MILVDSSVLIDYFNGADSWQVQVLDDLLGNEVIAIGDIILAEVLRGFRSDKEYLRAKSVLRYFPCYELCGEQIAIKSAEHFRALRKKGITVRKTIDGIIATFCIENRFQLLHNDRDFVQYEKYFGLQTVKKRGV
jgi:hypothetical protein